MTATGLSLRTSALAPFRERAFLLLWWGTLLSNFGVMAQGVGAAWLMATLEPSPAVMALIQSASTLPIMLLALPAGALADIFDRRALMLAAQATMALASGALAVLGYMDAITSPILLICTFVLGCGSALNGPTWQSSIGELVPREDVPAAVALNSLSFNAARSVGPALGGVLVAAAGAPAAFMANAISYLPVMAALIAWRRERAKPALPPEGLFSAVLVGVRYVSLSRPIGAAMARGLALGFCSGALWALLPVVARDRLGGGPLVYGTLLGCFGLGALIGALPSSAIRRRLGPEGLWTAAALAFSGASLTLGVSHSLWLAAPAQVVAGMAWLLGLSTLLVAVQLAAPRWVVGRAIGAYQVVAFGALCVGSAAWGVVTARFGLTVSLGAAGILLAILTLAARRFPLEAHAADLAPAGGEVSPPRLDLDHAAGPVVVTVAYRVAPQNTAAFARAMHDLGRARRRDGALGWSLMQDIDDPEQWLERFHSPSWLEHQRRRTRPTMADQALLEAVTSLAAGETTVVRRYIERPNRRGGG